MRIGNRIHYEGLPGPDWRYSVDTTSTSLRLQRAAVVALLLVSTALVGASGFRKEAKAAVPEFTNLAHVYNFLPPSPPAQATRRGSDHEFYSAVVPKRDYATGQLLDAAGNPLPAESPPVMVLRDFAVMGSYGGGGWIFDITDPEAVQFVANVPCNQTQNDVQIKQFGDRWVLALTRDGNANPCIASPAFGPNNVGGLAVFDITDPYNFRPMYSFRTTGAAHNFTFHPHKPYGWVSTGDLPGGANHIPIINFTNLDNPLVVNDPPSVGGPHDILFSTDGVRAYVASENNHRIYNTTDPANPSVVFSGLTPNDGTYAHGLDPTPDRRIMVGTNESLALGGFFAAGTSVCPGEGLTFYRIEGAMETAPVAVGEFLIDMRGPSVGDGRACTGHVGKIAPNSRAMTLGWYRGGVRVVDFSNPSTPTEVGKAVLDGTEVWAAKFYKGPYVYASDTRRGFDVYKWTGSGPAPWLGQADLSVVKSDSRDPTPLGRNFTWTITVRNNGPDAAFDVNVTDTLPPGVDFVSATASQGSCGRFGGVIGCSLWGLVNGATATVDVVVTARQAGFISNTASASSATGDSVGANNTDSEVTFVCRVTSRRQSIPCG
jgi:uncharacterized repeat protein (TIGR01451 family)